MTITLGGFGLKFGTLGKLIVRHLIAGVSCLGEISLQGVIKLVKMYGSEETRAFCCNCKEVTLHRYESFSKPKEVTEKKAKGFFSGLFSTIIGGLMEGEATGDYKCTVCGTNLKTPDNLD